MSESEFKLQDALLARVRELTAGHGQQKVLAEHLGISPTTLSGYLAEKPSRRPNGETTLALQEWVKRQRK